MSVLGAYWYWFAAGAALIGLEAVVPGVMLLWMGVGAVLVGALLSLLPDLPAGVQMVVFAIAMSGSVGGGFLIQRRRRAPPDGALLNRGLDGFIGRTAVASGDFVHGVGRINLEDSTYAARAQGGAVITKDEPVRIVGREQASFIVEELDS